MTKGITILLTLIAPFSAGCAKMEPVTTAEAACAVATARVTAQRRLPTSHVALCDHIPGTASPRGYYVMALRARCPEGLCGSTNMGWIAVQKATGDVFEWDVADSKLGQPVADGS